MILKGPFDEQEAARYDLTAVAPPQGCTLFPLEPAFCDHHANALGIHDRIADEPLLNVRVVHELVRRVAGPARFALVESDYHDGGGPQAAAVYEWREVMAPRRDRSGVIGEALEHLGLEPEPGSDRFDTLGLGQHRDFDHLFER